MTNAPWCKMLTLWKRGEGHMRRKGLYYLCYFSNLKLFQNKKGVCLYACTILFYLLWLCERFWNQKVWCLHLYSFSRLFWPKSSMVLMKFRIVFSISVRNATGILTGSAEEPEDCLGSYGNLNIKCSNPWVCVSTCVFNVFHQWFVVFNVQVSYFLS